MSTPAGPGPSSAFGPTAAQRPAGKTLTPALIAALVGLALLAIVTVVVVTSSDDGPSGGGASASSSQSSSAQPSGETVEATDGSFTYQRPPGFEDAIDEVSLADAKAAIMDYSTDADFPTHVVVNAETGSGTLDEVLSSVRGQIEWKFSTTTDVFDPDLDSVDGEPFKAWKTGAYEDGDQPVASAQIMTQRDGTFYYFTVNALPDNQDDAIDALVAFVESITWV